MKDEEHHIDFLETQLDLIGRIGLELYTQKHVGGLESEHSCDEHRRAAISQPSSPANAGDPVSRA